MKNGEVILCSGIKLDKEYENVLSYNESAMVNLCRSNSIATSTRYSILDPSVGSMDVAISYDKCITANYIAFRNPYYGNKWYFGFVNKVKFLNPETTTIEYTIDVFSTWYEKMRIGKAFIEREHVSDDTFGKHTVKENLDVGEMVINSTESFDEYANDFIIVAGVSKLPKEIYSLVLASGGYPSRLYNGIFSGLTYIAFETYISATKFLLIMDGQGISENVYDIFIIPKSIVTIYNNQWVTTSCTGTITIPQTSFSTNITFDISYYILPDTATEHVMKSDTEITMNSTLNGYTPKNNKMFTGEFNYMYISNNVGGDAKYNYEDFYENTPIFTLVGAVCPGCSIRLIPKNYKNYDQAGSTYICNPYGLTGGKYPTCSWSSDSYTNWLTQQSVNINLDRVGNVGATVIASAVNPYMGLLGGLGLVTDAIKKQHDAEISPVQAKGNINSGDVTYAMGLNQFILYRMSCRYEYAKICDDYLSRFGYKVNEVKTPNLKSRREFNFIKVGGMDELVSGNIPASDLDEINRIFRKGVTIFHNYSNFGNYTISNGIR